MTPATVRDFVYLGVIVMTIGVSWGMFSSRLDAVETKADKIAEIQSDIAVIKEKISSMEKLLQEK